MHKFVLKEEEKLLSILKDIHGRPDSVTTMDELLKYLETILSFMKDEFNSSADGVINILVKKQIYDKNTDEIIDNCKTIRSFTNYYEDATRQIGEYVRNMSNQYEQIKIQKAQEATDAYDPYYIGVISTSSWDVLMADLLNDKEERNTAKKRQRYYDREMRVANSQLTSIANNYAIEVKQTLQHDIYEYGVQAITEMYNYCVIMLIQEGKLPSNLLENLQKSKSKNILQNIDKIENDDERKAQIVVSLQADPFNIDTNKMTLENSIANLEDYLKFVKFIKYEDIISEVCVKEYAQTNNENYLKIVKELGGERFLSIYLSTLDLSKNKDIIEQINATKELFEKLKEIFGEKDIIIEQEKHKIEDIADRIKETYMAKADLNPAFIDYDGVTTYLNQSKDEYITEKLKYKKKQKKLLITFAIILGIMNLIILQSGVIEMIVFSNIFVLLVDLLIYCTNMAVYDANWNKNRRKGV